jgi:hypothetical protein
VPCTSRALFRGGIELRRFDEAIVYRTKVWEYPGVNTFRTGRLDELAMHPTVKPVAMLADAIHWARISERLSSMSLVCFAQGIRSSRTGTSTR